jgi:hypothetical protein
MSPQVLAGVGDLPLNRCHLPTISPIRENREINLLYIVPFWSAGSPLRDRRPTPQQPTPQSGHLRAELEGAQAVIYIRTIPASSRAR